MENYKYEIGLRLKQARKDKSLTQEKISELLGISQKHYSEAERGITGLSVKHLIKISDILSVSLDYLLKGSISENMSKSVRTNNKINEVYFSASDYTQQKMLDLILIAKAIETNSRTSRNKRISENEEKLPANTSSSDCC